jgi:rare lipoprotein A (peptidoglycan hydrolase)
MRDYRQEMLQRGRGAGPMECIGLALAGLLPFCAVALAFVVGALGLFAGLIALVLAMVPKAYAETGLASWYSGGGTACGDHTVQPFTAAHKSLPCNAVVRVTTRAGSVVVTIRDRGPFVRGRIIDLDRQSAGAVGLIGPGVLPATVERIR